MVGGGIKCFREVVDSYFENVLLVGRTDKQKICLFSLRN